MLSTLEKNVSRWQKCDTILETLIQMVCSTRQKRITIHLKCDTILGSFLAYLFLSYYENKGYELRRAKWDFEI